VVVWARDVDAHICSRLSLWKVQEVVVASPRLRESDGPHATDRFRDTVADLLVSAGLPRTNIGLNDLDRRQGIAWLSRNGLSPSAVPVVGVHAGSGSRSKCWSPGSFARVIEALRHEGIDVILLEGPADEEATAAVVRALPSLTAMRVPRLRDASLLKVAEILAHCSAFLGNDSGLTQLAGALGIPTVGIFGPTDPAVWAWRGDNVRALQAADRCRCSSPEMQRDCAERVCFAIQPDAVLTALNDALHSGRTLAGDPLVC
jgi:ADP-heptose:LPS heptosyltransferase